MKVPSTIDQPPSFPAAGSFPEGLDLRVYASGWPFAILGAVEAEPFGPKALVFALALLGSHPLPSAFRR